MAHAQPRPPREAVLDTIRRGATTVTAIAAALEVTDNAVRLHLAALERDGLVRRAGAIRSGRAGQPAAAYALTAAGQDALSRAYPAALVALVAALGARLESRTLRATLADAGARMAAGGGPGSATTLAGRAAECADLLRALGGAVDVEAGRGGVRLVGHGCPLASAVAAEPATCTIVEALLEERCGVRARQQCVHGAAPACRFVLTT
jgi:predicted ArsR family transcriptional regulator